MRLLGEIALDETIAVFLQTERTSARFGPRIQEQLDRDGRDANVVERPDLTSLEDNAYRRRLLVSYRAYLFDDLSEGIVWRRARLTPDEVLAIRYVDYSYWNELSGHTRLPAFAAKSVRAGERVFGVGNEGFLAAEEALRAGARFPELILRSTAADEPLTVIEGHLRLTAYALAPECLPDELEVVIGFAPGETEV